MFVCVWKVGEFLFIKEVSVLNYCDIGVVFDEWIKCVMIVFVIDNLVKGVVG